MHRAAPARRPPHAEFEREEYASRWERAQALMGAAGLDALFVSSESNFRYLSGHVTPFWVSKTRPLFCLLPASGPPTLLVTGNQLATARATSWVDEVRTWAGFAAEGVTLVAETLTELGLAGARIGAELGEEQRLGLPHADFLALERRLPGAVFEDAAPLLWRLRMIKSPAEIDCLRRSAAIAGAAYRELFAGLRAGVSEREAFVRFVSSTIAAGAERPGYVPIHSGAGNYGRIAMGPTDRRLADGDLFWMDGGCVYRGYWSDFARLAAVGRASARQREVYRRVREIMHECAAAIRPGLPLREPAVLAERRFAEAGLAYGSHGRVGHGLGLDITEPPSLNAAAGGLIEAGMVLTIEPTCAADDGFFQLEEIVAVTADGGELLTEPAPPELPILPGAQG